MAFAISCFLPKAPGVFLVPRGGAPSPFPPFGSGLLMKFVNLANISFTKR
jgi:hypothetical protein